MSFFINFVAVRIRYYFLKLIGKEKSIKYLQGGSDDDGAVATMGYDIYGVNEWRKDPTSKDAVHPSKMAMDAAMLTAGICGGPWGAGISIVYFGGDLLLEHLFPGYWTDFVVPQSFGPLPTDERIEFIDSPIDISIPTELLDFKANRA